MGIIARQSIFNTIISYLGVLLGIVLTLWLYLLVLEPAEYGLTRIMISLAFIGSQIAGFGFKNITIRYFPYYKDPERRHNGFLFWSLIIPLCGYLLLTLAMYLFKPSLLSYYDDNAPLLRTYYDLLLLLIFFTLFFNLLSSYMHALFNTKLVSFLQEVLLRVLIILVLVIYMLGWVSQSGFFLLFVLTYSILPLIILIYLAYSHQLFIKPDLQFFNIKSIKELANYGLYAVLGGIATLIVGKIDILMLGSMSGLADTGVYAIAFYIGSVITIPQRSISKIANPIIADAFKNHNMNNVDDIYKKSSLVQIMTGSLLLIGIWINIENLKGLIPSEYFTQPYVILVIGLAKLFNMATGTNGGIILNSKYYRYDLYTNILLIVLAVITNYLLIPVYGILGAAIATGISIFVYNSTKLIIVWVAFSIQPFTNKTFQIILISGFTVAFNYWLLPEFQNIWVDLVLRSSAVSLIFIGLTYYFQVSEDVNTMIKRVLKI